MLRILTLVNVVLQFISLLIHSAIPSYCTPQAYKVGGRIGACDTGYPYTSVLFLFFLLLMPGQARAQQAGSSDLYILAIGVSQYPHFDDPKLQLQYADDDAASMVRWAESQKGHLYRNVTTHLLVNQQATRADIITAMLELLRGVGAGDQVIIFLSGHGVVDPYTGKYHFLTSDTELKSKTRPGVTPFNSVAATALSQSDLLGTIDQASRQSPRVLLLLDTCQSGAVGQALAAAGEKGSQSGLDLRPTPLDEKARVNAVITAGTAADKAAEGPQFRLEWEPPDVEGHGVFTWALLQALGTQSADSNRNGLVFLGEVWSFVSDKVRTATKGKQLPEISGRQADVPIAWAPGTLEVCDGRDNDLNGVKDEGVDANGDGTISRDESFDKNQNGIADCLEQERCNGLDDNGDGQIDEAFDQDGDGHRSMQLCGSRFGDDPDDTNYAIHPDQNDWGNLRDDDGDGFFDEDSPKARWNPEVPDVLEEAYIRQRTRFRSSLAGSLLCGVVGVTSLARLPGLVQDIRADGVIDDIELEQLRAQLITGIGFSTLSAVGVGISGTFAWDGHRIKTQLFPPAQTLALTSGNADVALRGGRP